MEGLEEVRERNDGRLDFFDGGEMFILRKSIMNKVYLVVVLVKISELVNKVIGNIDDL